MQRPMKQLMNELTSLVPELMSIKLVLGTPTMELSGPSEGEPPSCDGR